MLRSDVQAGKPAGVWRRHTENIGCTSAVIVAGEQYLKKFEYALDHEAVDRFGRRWESELLRRLAIKANKLGESRKIFLRYWAGFLLCQGITGAVWATQITAVCPKKLAFSSSSLWLENLSDFRKGFGFFLFEFGACLWIQIYKPSGSGLRCVSANGLKIELLFCNSVFDWSWFVLWSS